MHTVFIDEVPIKINVRVRNRQLVTGTPSPDSEEHRKAKGRPLAQDSLITRRCARAGLAEHKHAKSDIKTKFLLIISSDGEPPKPVVADRHKVLFYCLADSSRVAVIKQLNSTVSFVDVSYGSLSFSISFECV